MEDDGSVPASAAAIRAAKKGARPRRITETVAKPQIGKQSVKVQKKKKKGSAFDEKRTATKGSNEGMRAKPTKVSLTKKGKPGTGKGRSKGKK